MKTRWNARVSRLLVLLLCFNQACNLPGSRTPGPTIGASPPEITETAPAGTLVIPESPTEVQTDIPVLPDLGNLRVVYASEDNLMIWSDGSARQLTTSGDVYQPRISPDGEVIAYLRPADDFHLEIWAINSDGTGERRLVSVADMDAIGGGVRDASAVAVNPYRFRWVPGKRVLAFNSHQVFQGPGVNLLNDLNLVDVDALKISNLLLSGWGGEFTISPDGDKIAISQPDKIVLSNADGSEYRTVLTYDPVLTYSEYRYYAMPTWSKDSGSLLVALPPPDPLARPAQPTEIWRISAGEAPPVMIGSVDAVPHMEQEVFFSPDLERIAYLRETGQPEENLRELHLAMSDGSGDWVYAKAAPIIFQGWSPDSSRFAYSLGQNSETWIGSLADAPQALGQAFDGAQNLRWVSPAEFIFWQLVDNTFDLRAVDLNGGSVLLDTAFGAPPAFSYAQP